MTKFYSKGQFSQRENSSITGSIVISKNELTEDKNQNNLKVLLSF